MRAQRDQHFLVDTRAVSHIADILEISGRRVLEIGPGQGVLTRALLDRGARVIAVELDHHLVDLLNGKFSGEIKTGSLTLIQGDATKADIPPFDLVVANLPYSVSSKIVFRLLEIGFESAVLMFQKEFADRMVSPIGSRDCGRLSVMVQTFARVSLCFNLPPSAFNPRPDVHSSVVRIEPREPIFPISDRVTYGKVVTVLYQKRRKTVRSILKGATGEFGVERIAYLLDNLDPEILSSRPENLYLEDYATISNLVHHT